MEEIIYQSYKEYKAELDGELQRTAESFVKIGYLLKVARDTNILAESGYASVSEFAEAEYNLNRTQVSRFMSINDKFSEGGYSDHLIPEYQGYGYAKLTIMLQLPDSINEELSPKYSKAEIQSIKEEIEEEAKVSDLERMIEVPVANEKGHEYSDTHLDTLYKAILQLGEDEPELYVAIADRKNEDLALVLPEIMAPAGDKMYSIHVRGIGRLMLSITDMSDTVKIINSRSGEKDTYYWDDVAAAWIYAGVIGSGTEEQSSITCWEQRYERKYPIAPVQQTKLDSAKKEDKKKAKKESKVKKAPSDWPSVFKIGQQVICISNDHIGELIGKADANGTWKVKFPTYDNELSENQFVEYVETEEITEVITTEPTQNNINEQLPKDNDTYSIRDSLFEKAKQLEYAIVNENWKNVIEHIEFFAKKILEIEAIIRGE